MRIGFVLYWCVFVHHLCNADDGEKTEAKEGGRRSQWGPGPIVRSNSFVNDAAVLASNELSKS